jgi:ATP/maltotriose-dependent transcriptional regulator MalT/DNA-binding SARP family transcriptional activator
MINRIQIPGKKFYPPRFAADQCLYRGNLIEKELGRRGGDRQVYIIEAQAGQGKTTLIQQFLERYQAPFFWYQCGEEDHDPVSFVTALLAGLCRRLPALDLPQLEQLLTAGRVSAADLAAGVETIRHRLAETVHQEFYLVFDDLHLLDHGGEQTLTLLRQLVCSAPPHLLFILAARRPSAVDFSKALATAKVLHLRNEQMALTLAETQELYRSVLQLDIPGTVLKEIHALTGGWVMGLVAFAHSIEQAGPGADLKGLLKLPRARERYQDYFRDEVFGQVPAPMQESLLLLSLLDEIPVPLAEVVTGRAAIGGELAALQARNFFLRSLDQAGRTYGMHHLFAEYLRERADRTLPRERVRGILHAAAEYYREQQATALDYFIRAEAWAEVERLLAGQGMTFIARNQARTLALLLLRIPEEVRAARGWMLLFSAVTDNEAVVVFSLEKLEQARRLFEEKGDRKGNLLALSQIIWQHMASTGLFQEGNKLLAPADRLFAAIGPELSVDEEVIICRNIGAGALLFDFDTATSGRYLGRGEALARRHGLSGHLSFILIFQAYILMFQGRTRKAVELFEEIYPLFFSQQMGVIGKLGILTLRMNLLESLREVEVFAFVKGQIPEHLTQQQMFNFILGPYLMLWDLDLGVVTGDCSRAVQVYTNRRREIEALNPHYQSQVLRDLAYLFSLNGERDQALELLGRADALRRLVGSRYYLAYHQIFAGATYAQCGSYELARVELDLAIASLRGMGNEFLLVSALIHRAWLSWQEERVATAATVQDLTEALDLSARHDLRHFRSVPPVIMEPLLSLAVQRGILPNQCGMLARALLKSGVTTRGRLIPLLELKFLGGISILYQGQVVRRSEELPHLHRELLALLVSMPGEKVSQEQVQGVLWPESTEEKARSNLDTLLSRLRASLGEVIPKNDLKHYISLQKGMISLRHCSIDILAFRREVRQGLPYLAARQAWRAENCFLKALAAWQGPFAPEIFGLSEQVLFCRSELLAEYAKMVLAWAKGLREMGRAAEAIELLRAAKGFLPTDDRLLRQLYQMVHEVSFQQASQLLAEYRQALLRDEYTPAEVEAIIDQVSA